MSAVEGAITWLWTKVGESEVQRDTHKDNTSPKPMTGKMSGANFFDFL